MTKTLLDGLCFGEGPRWHEGRLWFSDMHGNTVYAADLNGNLETIVTLEGDQPSGLGWLPDGRLLIVSMTRRQLLVFNKGGLNRRTLFIMTAKNSHPDQCVVDRSAAVEYARVNHAGAGLP